MYRSLLETASLLDTTSVPYITMEQDVVSKLENALSAGKPLLILFQSPFGHHQLSGFITEIDSGEQRIRIENGALEKQILISQVLLVIEWN